MLSANKRVLLIATLAAVAGATLPLLLAVSVHMQWLPPERLRPYLGLLLALPGAAFICAIVLQIEYAQALRGGEFNLLREESLSFGQFMDSIRWCPQPLALGSLILAPVCMVVSLLGGTPAWSSDQPLTVQVARGFMLFIAPFALFALPIVISGYRVRGSFTEHFRRGASDA